MRWFFNARAGRAIEILKGVFGIAWRVAWRLFGTGLRPVQLPARANRLGTNRNELRFDRRKFDFSNIFYINKFIRKKRKIKIWHKL